METVLNVIFYLLVSLGLGIAVFVVYPAFAKAYRMKNPSKNINMKLPYLLESFKNTSKGSESGRLFIDLLRIGYFRHIKTANHGNNFPDQRQYEGFIRHTTPEIMQSIDNLGDSLERYFV